MLRDLITWVLNTYLGKYLENLNSAQLTVALLSGEVELENVPIRKDALRSLGLPVEVACGSIGKIKLQIPVRQFRTSPWCIYIEGIFCVICPKDLQNWDDASEKMLELERKLAALDNVEADWRLKEGHLESHYFSSYNNWMKHGTNMLTNIIDNIELKINNVHFRYEDSVALNSTKIVAGIKIGSLTAQSCDCDWKLGGNRKMNTEMNYKIVELNELSLYWDELFDDIKCQNYTNQELLANMDSKCNKQPHTFIVRPVSAIAQWKLDKTPQEINSKDRPRVSCKVMIPEVIIALSNVQYIQMREKLFVMKRIMEVRSYRLKRPNCKVSENPKMWWKYVLDCQGIDMKTSAEKFVKMTENLRYMRIYQRVIINCNINLSKEDKSFKACIESDRNISELIILRRVCFDNAYSKGLSIKSQNQTGRSMLFHWFPNWIGWYGTNTGQSVEQDESEKKIEDDILIAIENSIQSSSELKRDAIFGHFTIELGKGLAVLNSVVDNKVNSMNMEFNNLSAFLELNPLFTSYAIGISLGKMYLLDKTNEVTKHPYLIQPQTDDIESNKKVNTKDLARQLSDSDPLFKLYFENNNQVRCRLNIKSKSLDITYNNSSIKWFVSFFATSNKSLNYNNKIQSKNATKFMKNWNNLIIENLAHRKVWTFEIEVFAPRIIFLENIELNNSLMILMDFGKFEMFKTDFQKKVVPDLVKPDESIADDEEMYLTPCSTPPASEKSGLDTPPSNENILRDFDLSVLHTKIYNEYTIKLADLQVLVCKHQEKWKASLKNSSSFHLIDKFDITLTFQQRTVFTIDPEYPAFTICGTLPTILIHGNEENINSFFKIMSPICHNQFLLNEDSTSNIIYEEKQEYNSYPLDGSLSIVTFSIDQLIIEMQSKEKSIAELQINGARANFTKTAEETNITMSIHGLLLVDAIQAFGPDFELLVASHRHVGMDRFSGSLKHSTACSPTSPVSPDPIIDLRPNIINQAVRHLQKGSHSESSDEDELNSLISIKIRIPSPNNNTNNECPIQSTNITFNNLDIIANHDTILELMDFTKRTILDQKIFQKFKSNEFNVTATEAKESEDSFNHMNSEIRFDFYRLNVLLLYTIQQDKFKVARKVGTLTMSEANIYASIQTSYVSVIGSLGGIQVIDISPDALCHQRILSVGKDPQSSIGLSRPFELKVLSKEIYQNNFHDEVLEQSNALNFKIHWSERTPLYVHARMASVWYTHCPRFLQDFNVCLTNFKRSLRQFFTSIRNKATGIAKEFVQQMKDASFQIDQTLPADSLGGKSFSLDVIINTPIIILPTSNDSTEVLVASLGKICCCNNIQNEEIKNDCDNLETYAIDIKNISLFSLNIGGPSKDFITTLPNDVYSWIRNGVPIVHNTAISLQICLNYTDSSGSKEYQKCSIDGTLVEKLKVSLYRTQYEQLINSLNNATNFSYEISTEVVQDLHLKTGFTTRLQFALPVLEINLQNETQETLINVIFKNFKIKYSIEENYKDLEVKLHSVLMEDLRSDISSPFRNMVTSKNLDKRKKKMKQTSTSCPELSRLHSKQKHQSISMPSDLNNCLWTSNTENNFLSNIKKKVEFADRNNMENLVVYKSQSFVPQQQSSKHKHESVSSIDFNCLNLAICVDKWFVIFDFFGLVSHNNTKEGISNLSTSTSDKYSDVFNKLTVSIRSLNFMLIRNEAQLSKVNVSNATFIIAQESLIKSIEGWLESVAVYDLTKFGKIYKQKFVTSGSEAFSFIYKKNLADLAIHNPLYADSVLRINMSSVQYIHTKRFIVELHLFVKELLQLQTPVIKNLKKQKVKNDEQLTMINISIEALSPVIVLPASFNSNYVLIANLEKFTITNSYHYSNEKNKIQESLDIQEVLDVMNIDLVHINLYSGELCTENVPLRQNNRRKRIVVGNMNFIQLGQNLFKESYYLKLQVKRNLNTKTNRKCPDIGVNGTFAKLNIVIDVQQYKIIRGILNNNLGEEIDDVYYNYSQNLNQSLERLSSIQDISTNKQHNTLVFNILLIKILLEDVSIVLVRNAIQGMPMNNLACIHFIKSSLQIDSFSDGSHDIDLISSNILIVDERHGSDKNDINMFKNILQPSKTETLSDNTVQAEIHCRKRANFLKYTIMLNNMRVISILSFLENVKNFLQEGPISSPVINNQSILSHHLINKPNFSLENEPTIEYAINITESEIIFVEQCKQIDSNAIILKSTTVISYKPNNSSVPLSIDINHLEIFSCKLEAEDESALSIIDPFTLNIELRNCGLHAVIEQQLNIRLSYNDMKLFTRMLRSIPKQGLHSENISLKRNDNYEKIAPLVAMGFEITECWEAMEFNNWRLNDSALWLAQQKRKTIQKPVFEIKNALLDANFISICVIDDCLDADVPLLEISFSKLLLKYKIQNTENANSCKNYCTEGDIDTEMTINYYNRRLSGWEPVAEPWECIGKWKLTKLYTDKKNRVEISIDSSHLLKINITSTLCELFKMVQSNWTSDFYECDANSELDNKSSTSKQRSPFIPFALQNLTGTPLLFKPMYAELGQLKYSERHQQELIKNWISVQPNEIKTFDFSNKSKLRHIDSHRLNLHQILVQLHGWKLIGPLSIDKVGVFFRTTNLDSQYEKKTRIVFDISLIGSAQKLVKVQSAVRIINKLDKEILVKMVLNDYQQDQHIITSMNSISPNEEQCLPLKFMDSALFIKHGMNTENKSSYSGNEIENIGFSNREISWRHYQKDSQQSMQISHDVSKSVLYTLININKEISSYKESNLPGHSICILPPLKIKNMLCCDLIFEINGYSYGRIGASENVNIYNVNIYEPFNLSITLDNFQLSGKLKVPMSYVGIVEPKLKLIDFRNRELHLRISIQSFQKKGMEIYISAPVWIVNKTGLPLIYKQEGTNKIASGQFDEHERARQVAPLMFSFSDQEGSPALEVRLGNIYGCNNQWCKSFSIHKQITYRELRGEDKQGSYAIGIRVRRGRGLYSCTTFVTLSPRFQLYNKSGCKLEFAQQCDVDKHENLKAHEIITAPINCNFPFHWPNSDREPHICVRFSDVECCCWSKGVPVNEIQSVYINVRNEWGEMFFLRLEVISMEAQYILLFTDARSLPPPIRIDNFSEVIISFSQKDSKPNWPTPVKARSSLSYVMDDPLGSKKLLLEAPGGNTIEFPINMSNNTKSLIYTNFIYIAFHQTFEGNYEVDHNRSGNHFQQLVLGVRDKKVIIMEKNYGDRSQLWLMNSNGQLEHEGSSPPILSNEVNFVRLVLDLETPPNPNEYTKLVVRAPNKQRLTTQTWRFENGRLMCHAKMCVQAKGDVNGLFANVEAVLGRTIGDSSHIPINENVVAQKLRPGSGQLEVSNKMDGPICTVQIFDIKTKQNELSLAPDVMWTHASINNSQIIDGNSSTAFEFVISCQLPKGVGISIISRKPCEEIIYISLETIFANILQTPLEKSLHLNISYIQIDNQLLDAVCSRVFNTSKSDTGEALNKALVLKLQTLPSPNKSAIIFKYVVVDVKPSVVYVEERLILKMAKFLGLVQLNNGYSNPHFQSDLQNFEERLMLKDMKRYYFENLCIGSTQVRLSAITSPKLPTELQEAKKMLGLTLIKFEDALIELDKFSDKYHFETMDVYMRAMKLHYINQIKWHAASILGSVDFLGNPLGFANDLSEGVSGLIFEGSVKSLVKNVTHGISNSTAKLTETLSDGLGRVILDDHDNETRQRILAIQSNTSGSHLAAGMKGFGFGLLGGVTSLVRHTYDGAQSDGVPGFLSGLGKGIVGTVTKPLIGLLDLASETASAVRETSRGGHRSSLDRIRLPRCVTGAPGGLLPPYSSRQSKGQQYIYIINRRNFEEKFISYEPNLWSDKDARLRLLVSSEYVRIFSLCDGIPTIMFECHLSEILSCHPLITNAGNSPSSTKLANCFYIEISTNLPKITRPRIRCRTEESAEAASRCINYAKSVFDEREHSLSWS